MRKRENIPKHVPQQLNFRTQYPDNPYYEYRTKIQKIDFDERRVEDIKSGKGFIISAPKGIKKDVKNQDGIFSSRYGSNSIVDTDPYSTKYRCKCGHKTGSINNGELCEICGTRVTFMDDDISITGYLKLKDNYWIIHPNMYYTIGAFIGDTRLQHIIEPDIQVDSDGRELPVVSTKKDEPFRGIGLLAFHDRFKEVMDFYLAKYPLKKNYYDFIMGEHLKKTWTHTISVYSALLRPSNIDNGSLRYEACNDQFNMLASLVYKCNDDELEIDRKSKEKLQLLYDIQYQLNSLYNEISEILSHKKGDIRSSIGGRYAFSERSVIRQDVNLKADEVKLPFAGLCELLQQVIINILIRSYNFSYSEAYKKWYRCQITGYDQAIYDILDNMIKYNDGLPILINRNPK